MEMNMTKPCDLTKYLLTVCMVLLGSLAKAGAEEPVPAAIPVVVFSDFECPFCARAATQLEELERSNAGKIQLLFKHAPLDSHQRAPLAHKAALAAGEQNRFREMHDAIFENQTALDRTDLLEIARRIGMDMVKFEEALDSKRIARALEHDTAEASALGIEGRPTIFIRGQRIVGAAGASRLQKALNAGVLPEPAEELPNKRIVQPALGKAPIRGTPGAPVTIIVFSDFECPFCGRFNETLEALRRQMPGQIRIAFKHFPLPFHVNAPLAHRAALAAGKQGKFWDMHDVLFRRQSGLKPEDFLRTARELSLDMARFQEDMESEGLKSELESDLQQGRQSGVSGTPTFFVNKRVYSGAISIEQLKSAVELELKTLTVAAAR